MSRYFSYKDFHDIDYPPSLSDAKINSTIRADDLNVFFQKLGLDTSTQHFSWKKDDDFIEGANVQAILRSPRAEGTEAILISAPQLCINGKCIIL